MSNNEALRLINNRQNAHLISWQANACAELRRLHDLLGKANALCRIRAEEIERLKAQPEQEPVACVQDLDEVKRKHLVYEKGMDWKDPLYTTPPQRTWVGLTDEEVSEVLGSDIHDEPSGELDFIRAIEAKLKEKNT